LFCVGLLSAAVVRSIFTRLAEDAEVSVDVEDDDDPDDDERGRCCVIAGCRMCARRDGGIGGA